MSLGFQVVVGTKRYSSWSLRGWLAAKASLGNNFEEIKLVLNKFNESASDSEKDKVLYDIKKYSPSGKVPVLIDREVGVTVYDSLAIVLYLADRFPQAHLLPTDLAARGSCLSACAEMHSEFAALRSNCPHNCVDSGVIHGEIALQRADVQADITRIATLWTELRQKYGSTGPYLFGTFSAADCMFIPVAIRFHCYNPSLSVLSTHPLAAEYVTTALNNEWVQEWIAEARTEDGIWRNPTYDAYTDEVKRRQT